MATSDIELIAEARSLTGYTEDYEFTDADIQELVDIAKEELRSYFGDAEYSFYQGDHDADRALFWFTCIAIKVRAGEIGTIDLSVESLDSTDSTEEYNFWFENFSRTLRSAEAIFGTGASSTQIERTDRTYAFERR